jgi:hypothetical protein
VRSDSRSTVMFESSLIKSRTARTMDISVSVLLFYTEEDPTTLVLSICSIWL